VATLGEPEAMSAELGLGPGSMRPVEGDARDRAEENRNHLG
jgi:hypothetical protein